MPRITPVPYHILVKIFETKGFQLYRQKGDHLVYVKVGISRPVVIPMYQEVPVFIIKNNLRTGKITREEYFATLEKL